MKCDILWIDNSALRFMSQQIAELSMLRQTRLAVSAATTVYEFTDRGMVLGVESLSPLLTNDIELLSLD